jgi:hypothetical protein
VSSKTSVTGEWVRPAAGAFPTAPICVRPASPADGAPRGPFPGTPNAFSPSPRSPLSVAVGEGGFSQLDFNSGHRSSASAGTSRAVPASASHQIAPAQEAGGKEKNR